MVIDGSAGTYFLDSSYLTSVSYMGKTYESALAAFRAQKENTQSGEWNDVKWNAVKVRILRDITLSKFMKNDELKEKLLATGSDYIENECNDRFWGTMDGAGYNLFGKILMRVRELLAYGMAEDRNLLFILEKEEGWYNGYLKKIKDDGYERVFATTEQGLFDYIWTYADLGYHVEYLDRDHAAGFLQDKWTPHDGTAVIWRYDVSSALAFGRSRKAIKTSVNLSDHKVENLHGGFTAIVVTKGPARGVYEFTSGGLVGNTVEQVNRDIDEADIDVVRQQVKDAATVRDAVAVMVSNGRFGILDQ